MSVDPYAYFLAEAAETRYNERLAERGMGYQGEPDRGHALIISKHSLRGSTNTKVRNVSKYIGSPESWTETENAVIVPSSTPGVTGFGRSFPLPSGTELETFGQQAYARTAPTAKVFDAAQFLGELREGLPSIIPSVVKSGARFYKGIGSDYLNVEFGWKPFLNDLIKAGQALAGATNMLAGNGKRVHRRYGVPPLRTSNEMKLGYVSCSMMLGNDGNRLAWTEVQNRLGGSQGNGPAPAGYVYALRTEETTRWFEGEFTSFFRLGFDPSSYLDRLNELVNLKLTPAVLWELAPWSWLIDWFLRVGDTIKANELAANDLLVMHYGYAMEQNLRRDFWNIDFPATHRNKPAGSTYSYWPVLPDSVSYVAESVHKRRIRANPYGFRTGGTSALSQGQVSILGALGLTRLK
jgi:hypothetical protein